MSPLKHSRRLLAVAAILLSAICASAQRTSFYNLNVENGLIQSQVWAIAQDHYGHLWMGTLGGLARYDGKNFTNYTIKDGIANNEITALAFDKNGKLWIGNRGYITSFDGRTFRNFELKQDKSGNLTNTLRIHVDESNKVWFVADNKVYNVVSNKVEHYPTPGKDSVVAILPLKKELWVAGAEGNVVHFHNNRWDTLYMPALANSPFLSRPLGFFRDSKGTIWINANTGLFRIENNKIVVHRLNEHLVNYMSPYLSMTEDNKGDLWLGTLNGVVRLTSKSLIHYNKSNGLSDNNVRSLFTDAEGNVWIGTDGQGIFRFSGSLFTVLDESMGLKSAQIRSLTGDGTGKIYLGTMDAGLYTYDGQKINSIPIPYTPTPTIQCMETGSNGTLWIGTSSGLISYSTSFKLHRYPVTPNFPLNSSVTALYNDSQNRLWIGFSKKILYYQNDSFYNVPSSDIFVRSFLELSPDSILIATNDRGLMLYNSGSIQPFPTHSVIDSASILCFTLRNKNELWVGTSDNGVVRCKLNTGECYTLDKSNGLRSDFIYNIITDNSSNIWIGTGFGIHKISINEQDKPLIKFYGKSQGVSGMESNHNAVYKMNDGSIWFGTTNGALHYQPQSQATVSKPLSIVLQSVKLFGENITDTSYYDSTAAWYQVPYGLHLPPKKNNLTFSFQAISLSGGNEQISYRYRIEGLEAPWSDWSPTNSVTFSALPPGKYTLHVESNTGGELHYPFEIITPFHKTGWFRLLILAGCILLGITLQYVANRIKQNRIKLIERTRREEQNKVRQRTAEDFHDEVGNKLTRINVLANVLKNKIQPTPETLRIINQIEENTAELYSGTKDILWSLKPSNDGLYEILHRIRDFGGELFQDTDIDFVFLGTDMRWKDYRMPMDVGRNLIMIFKEALNNTLKYSKATKVTLDVRIKMRNVLQMTLRDNGEGFDVPNAKRGHGIDNMYVRAKRIKGRFYLDSRPGKGTIINLAFRLPPKESKAAKRGKYQ